MSTITSEKILRGDCLLSKEVKWLIFIIFFISTVVHITFTQTNNPNLGILMAIPLISYLLIHFIRFKKPKIQDFALQLPRKNFLLLSIIPPIILGLTIHVFFYNSNQ